MLEELDAVGADEELLLDTATLEELLDTGAALLLDANEAALEIEMLELLTELDEVALLVRDELEVLAGGVPPPPPVPLSPPPPPPPPPQATSATLTPIKPTRTSLAHKLMFGLIILFARSYKFISPANIVSLEWFAARCQPAARYVYRF